MIYSVSQSSNIDIFLSSMMETSVNKTNRNVGQIILQFLESLASFIKIKFERL